MADPGLIRDMVADGWGKEAAIDHVDAVTAAILARLKSGKSVLIDGVCRLTTKTKDHPVNRPPHHIGHLVRRRTVALSSATVLEEGEPHPDPRERPGKRSSFLPQR